MSYPNRCYLTEIDVTPLIKYFEENEIEYSIKIQDYRMKYVGRFYESGNFDYCMMNKFYENADEYKKQYED